VDLEYCTKVRYQKTSVHGVTQWISSVLSQYLTDGQTDVHAAYSKVTVAYLIHKKNVLWPFHTLSQIS